LLVSFWFLSLFSFSRKVMFPYIFLMF
jgi:hypothetical protein